MESLDRVVGSLEKQKASLEEKIAEIRREIRSIDETLMRIKAEYYGMVTDETVNLKNASRIYNERIIIDTINSSKNGLETSEIMHKLERQGHFMNYNTLRSYIKRMRDKGIIYRKPNKYQWYVSESVKADIFS